MLAVGMLAWVVRYVLFALGAPAQVRWMIILGIVLHGICYDFFFVTGQIYTDRVAPRHIRAQAQGLLVLFTLGLGMAIGAKVAGVIEAMHTTEASKAFASRVVEKTAEIEQIKRTVETAPDRAAVDARLLQLENEKAELRRQELMAIEWNPLWGKPAIFAAVILLLFVILFRDRGEGTENVSSKEAVQAGGVRS
jgi:MFS family permease